MANGVMARTVTNLTGSQTDEQVATVTRRIRQALDDRALRVVYQPIIQLSDGQMVAAEALSRFAIEPARSPASWFSDARRVGLGAELELAALDAALAPPARSLDGCRIAVNLTPSTISDTDLLPRLAVSGPSRIIVELAEWLVVDSCDTVRSSLASLRDCGVSVAVSGMGTRVSGLSHITRLAPDILKVDRELVHDLDTDPVRQGLVTAMVTFAGEVGSDIVAEGIETGWELEAVRALGIRYGQGVFLRPPVPPRTLPAARRTRGLLWNPGAGARSGAVTHVTAPPELSDVGALPRAACQFAPEATHSHVPPPINDTLAGKRRKVEPFRPFNWAQGLDGMGRNKRH